MNHQQAFPRSAIWSLERNRDGFVDDGISGAEFANRPGFLRLMNALKPRPRFQVLVMSEESRLGREAIGTAYALKQLVTAGVRVFFYLEDRERRLDTPTDKIMLSLTAFADELERERARQRTYEAMARKARSGHVTGGRVFGYDNVEILGPDGKRSHVERRVNDAEADVVRRIFALCAAGTGYTAITKRLNAERAPAPRSQQGRPSGWSPSTVVEVLRRPLYRGEIVWNRTRKRNRWGQHDQQPRAAGEWLRLPAPELRIVPEDIWQAAHARLMAIRARLEKVTGRTVDGKSGPRRRGNDSAYLLSGFAVCGGGLGVISSQRKGRRAFFYACTAYHKRGTSVCGNSLILPIERVDQAVLGALGGDVLREEVVQGVINGVLAELTPQALQANNEAARADLQRIEREIGRLTDAIAAGDELMPLLEALRQRQAHRARLAAVVSASDVAAVPQFDRRAIEAKVRKRIGQWRELLTTNIEDGRQLLREVLAGPLRFTPEGRSYRFEGEATLGQIVAGIAGLPTVLASPTGFEPVFWP